MNSLDKLMAYVKLHMPELDAEMQGMVLLDVCRRLNAITGENVPTNSSIQEGSEVFLAALKRMNAESSESKTTR